MAAEHRSLHSAHASRTSPRAAGASAAAKAVVLYFGGIKGARAFLSRLGLWRCPAAWASFLLLGIPLVFAAGAAVKGTLFTVPLPFDALGAALGAIVFMLLLGPVEEFGWRGVALPILQRHMAPLWRAAGASPPSSWATSASA